MGTDLKQVKLIEDFHALLQRAETIETLAQLEIALYFRKKIIMDTLYEKKRPSSLETPRNQQQSNQTSQVTEKTAVKQTNRDQRKENVNQQNTNAIQLVKVEESSNIIDLEDGDVSTNTSAHDEQKGSQQQNNKTQKQTQQTQANENMNRQGNQTFNPLQRNVGSSMIQGQTHQQVDAVAQSQVKQSSAQNVIAHNNQTEHFNGQPLLNKQQESSLNQAKHQNNTNQNTKANQANINNQTVNSNTQNQTISNRQTSQSSIINQESNALNNKFTNGIQNLIQQQEQRLKNGSYKPVNFSVVPLTTISDYVSEVPPPQVQQRNQSAQQNQNLIKAEQQFQQQNQQANQPNLSTNNTQHHNSNQISISETAAETIKRLKEREQRHNRGDLVQENNNRNELQQIYNGLAETLLQNGQPKNPPPQINILPQTNTLNTLPQTNTLPQINISQIAPENIDQRASGKVLQQVLSPKQDTLQQQNKLYEQMKQQQQQIQNQQGQQQSIQVEQNFNQRQNFQQNSVPQSQRPLINQQQQKNITQVTSPTQRVLSAQPQVNSTFQVQHPHVQQYQQQQQHIQQPNRFPSQQKYVQIQQQQVPQMRQPGQQQTNIQNNTSSYQRFPSNQSNQLQVQQQQQQHQKPQQLSPSLSSVQLQKQLSQQQQQQQQLLLQQQQQQQQLQQQQQQQQQLQQQQQQQAQQQAYHQFQQISEQQIQQQKKIQQLQTQHSQMKAQLQQKYMEIHKQSQKELNYQEQQQLEKDKQNFSQMELQFRQIETELNQYECKSQQSMQNSFQKNAPHQNQNTYIQNGMNKSQQAENNEIKPDNNQSKGEHQINHIRNDDNNQNQVENKQNQVENNLNKGEQNENKVENKIQSTHYLQKIQDKQQKNGEQKELQVQEQSNKNLHIKAKQEMEIEDQVTKVNNEEERKNQLLQNVRFIQNYFILFLIYLLVFKLNQFFKNKKDKKDIFNQIVSNLQKQQQNGEYNEQSNKLVQKSIDQIKNFSETLLNNSRQNYQTNVDERESSSESRKSISEQFIKQANQQKALQNKKDILSKRDRTQSLDSDSLSEEPSLQKQQFDSLKTNKYSQLLNFDVKVENIEKDLNTLQNSKDDKYFIFLIYERQVIENQDQYIYTYIIKGKNNMNLKNKCTQLTKEESSNYLTSIFYSLVYALQDLKTQNISEKSEVEINVPNQICKQFFESQSDLKGRLRQELLENVVERLQISFKVIDSE